MKNATYEIRPSRAALVTIDLQNSPVNAMNDTFSAMLDEVLARLEGDKASLTGVILTSAKRVFAAGGDVTKILELRRQGGEAAYAFVQSLKAQFRRLETFGVPVVAALNGSALGGGLELALATHHRIALGDPKHQFGFPEVSLGILPAGGGIVRSVRMLGLMKALPLLTEGRRLTPAEALGEGLVDELASSVDEMMTLAETWIAANPRPIQPWDRKGFAIPGGNMFSPANAAAMAAFPSMIFKKTRGLLPAAERILGVAAETTQVSFDAASQIESRGFCDLLATPAAENLIRTMFQQMGEITAGASRPAVERKSTINTLGVVGAGMMGRGIAYSAAVAGINVILEDVTVDAAEKGKAYSQAILDKDVGAGRKSLEERDAILDRIVATDDVNQFEACDLVIEAVFEDVELKKQIVRDVETILPASAIFATNTSTLPISLLAKASKRPDRFIGLHFFSPVDRMHIVEIICGEATSQETLAQAYDFVQKIKKTPIVVNDSRGFFTSRVFSVFVDEGDRLLKEGVSPILIENLARQIGMPVGPLAVQDEVMMDMLLRSFEANQTLDSELGDDYAKTYEVCGELCRLMSSRGRPGRGAGAGFYDYSPDGSKTLWPGLTELFRGKTEIAHQDVRDRLMFRMVIEAARCLDEGVVTNVRDGNVGSILAFGFPLHTGGVYQFVQSCGVDAFLGRATELANAYGERFSPPPHFAATLDRATGVALAA
ncbi:MAG TPA: 3-hydroxyacyl-CoA dehydrogenase NAD-binding domain-containing protein [Caulobacteraceae bacterium]|nr:3-hydroxyacyl-CoA dehydrogenase NAD-binding domain-containing protein [Caulobacteraceae bacterium]